MIPETVFLSNLPLVERIIKFVARHNHLSPTDADEFSSIVKLKLVENDYEILRKFEGKMSLSTYLTTIINRLFLQYRVAAWGKWRPSAEAKRLGDLAITLERLTSRDGYTLDEAVQMLRIPGDPKTSDQSLRTVYSRLPVRNPRPSFVDVASRDFAIAPSDPLEAAERRGQAESIGAVLQDVMSRLDDQDRAILRMRYFDGLKVADIATVMNSDAKKIYKRVERILSTFRRALAEQQISGEAITGLLAAGDVDFDKPEDIGDVRTIKSAEIPGVYVEPDTARRTLKELLGESKHVSRK